MSAKWRALQHRHRYTYSAVIFPQSYIEALNSLPIDTHIYKFYTELKELTSLNSIYSQVNHVKKVASAFADLLTNGEVGFVSIATRVYLEILFLENSLQLHRTLVAVLAKNRNFQGLIRDCFRVLCDEYGGVNGKGKRFCVSRVALSMMGSPKLGYLVEIVEECAVLVALDVVSGLNSVVPEVCGWSQPSPIVMEQCQEALSCMYYLLQRFPLKFSGLNCDWNGVFQEDSNVLGMILTTILSILKSLAFSRDCFVAAGVSFCVALQVCLSPEELGLVIMEGFFNLRGCSLVDSPEYQYTDAIKKIPYKGNLFCEIQDFSLLSRLCLIRGILTAISRTVLNYHFILPVDNLNGHVGGSNTVQTILYDGILLELCNYCENPTDSHFNFHTLTVMQICLQQIKTSIQGNLGNSREDYYPISEDMGAQILRIIWNNLEDPLSQTVKQVHLIFDLFLDIQSILHWAEDSAKIKSCLCKIALDLLRLGPRCKGRYVPLASLTRRLGAKIMLDMHSDLLFESAQAYIDDDVCCAVTTFLKCFLECLRDEFWSSDGVESGYVKYRSNCLPPFLFGLASGISKLRSNLNTYALPVLLELDVDSIFPMLAFVSVGQVGEETELVYPELSCTDMVLRVEQQVAVLVSLLKVSRFLALIEGDIDCCENSFVSQEVGGLRNKNTLCYANFYIKGIKHRVQVEWLVLALTHVDESLRIDAAESLFLNPKTSSLPSPLELNLLKASVPLNMRCCSTAFQMKWTNLFRKFFSRVRTGLERHMKQGSWQPLLSSDYNEVRSDEKTEETVVNRADNLFLFMKWLSSFLFFSCYPSAPYERKIMAMELLLVMLNVWSIASPLQEKFDAVSSESIYPYNRGFTSPDSTLLLVGSIIDSWDRLRESSFRILLCFPTPLPGISDQHMVREVIMWAKELVCSPRVRESDAGALTLRLIFRKYVLELGWIVRASGNVASSHLQSERPEGVFQNSSNSPTIEYVRSLIDWLHAAVEEGEKDLLEACKNSFVHGVLLTLRYTFEELDWNSNTVSSSTSEMRHALEKLLELVMRITSLALGVVSADAWFLPGGTDDMVDDDDVFLSEVHLEMDASASAAEQGIKNSKLVQDVQPSEQIVMVGCWLAMKEVSLLLGTITRKILLPTSESSKFENPSSDAVVVPTTSDAMLDVKQLETIGNHFLEVLLKMKHNGAIDKTRAGFTALCNRLLCSNDPRLCKLTDSWMEQLMERTVAKGQTVDDLLRRSAGIPAAFTALFLSEPEGTPKRLLPRALRWLIDVANRSLLDPTDMNLTKSKQATVSTWPPEKNVNEKTSKLRDEGVVPTVHTFNVLRAAFNDTNLATDTSGFSAEALIISIRSFSSSYWEVRNSACLSYTALVRRMIGFLNVQKRESARRALTGLEFFHRYPSLHPFLFDELKAATQPLKDWSCENPESNFAKVVHPSLCPVLILLSRFKPSTIASETHDALDPFLFMPFIRRCSIQSNLRVRVLASRALTGLVSNEKLPVVLLNIASDLPCSESQMRSAPVSSDAFSTTDGTHCASFNSIHGMLLQLISLLDNNCRNLADFCKKDRILGDLIQVLVTRAWIGSPRLCRCPILNGSFLSVLDNMLSIARTCQKSKNINAIWNLLCKSSSEYLDVEASHDTSYYDPTVAELRKQAAISYFNCVFQASKEVADEDILMPHKCSTPASLLVLPEIENASKFQERLMFSLSDASYEVRIATLKWLLLFVKATASGTEAGDQSISETSITWWIKTNLQLTMMKLLALENNHRCTHYILRILFTWNLLQFQIKGTQRCPEAIYVGGVDFNSVYQFWDKLVSLYKVARHAKTREALICCMGICVKRFAGHFTSSVVPDIGMQTAKGFSEPDQCERSALYDYITYYINLVEQHSASSEPVNMRKAAVESIIASGLLEQAKLIGSSVFNEQEVPSEDRGSYSEPKTLVNIYAHKILDIWFTCIKLLEDEDVELRRGLAMDVQKCFTSENSGNDSQTGVVPTQVERVIELSFEHLSSIFGHWLKYFNYLSSWVLNTANYVTSKGDLVRRVFDKEIDNHHEEKLLISQICCSHLEQFQISRSWAVVFPDKLGAKNYLQNWRMRFFHQLISFANDHVGKQGGIDWIGGVGNHKDAFFPLYANLLGFYALSNCIFNGEPEDCDSLLRDAVELGKTINPFITNPLISNLYSLVIKLHEKMAGATAAHLMHIDRDDSCWDGFDPYFLLR